MAGGRRSKLDEPHPEHGTRAEAIEAALQFGNYLETAAAYAGVSIRSVHRWLAEGRDADSVITEHGEAEGVKRLSAHEFRCWQFWHAVTRARASAETRNLMVIQKAAQDDWRAAAWYMERAFPRRWGHQGREPIPDELSSVSVEKARERLAALPDTPLAALADK